jgi:hypothetical protein
MARPSASFAQFFYRVNPDKTIEAICGLCFMGSDPVTNQAGLKSWELAHHCSEWMKQSA